MKKIGVIAGIALIVILIFLCTLGQRNGLEAKAPPEKVDGESQNEQAVLSEKTDEEKAKEYKERYIASLKGSGIEYLPYGSKYPEGSGISVMQGVWEVTEELAETKLTSENSPEDYLGKTVTFTEDMINFMGTEFEIAGFEVKRWDCYEYERYTTLYYDFTAATGKETFFTVMPQFEGLWGVEYAGQYIVVDEAAMLMFTDSWLFLLEKRAKTKWLVSPTTIPL